LYLPEPQLKALVRARAEVHLRAELHLPAEAYLQLAVMNQEVQMPARLRRALRPLERVARG